MNNKFFIGDILPGEGIGVFWLGMTWEELQSHLPQKYEPEQRHGCFVVKLTSLWFFIDDLTQAVNQIIALDNFKGKLYDKISIGSTGMDVIKTLGRCSPNDNLGYEVDAHPGVSFYFGPASDFELQKIKYIAVHRKHKLSASFE